MQVRVDAIGDFRGGDRRPGQHCRRAVVVSALEIGLREFVEPLEALKSSKAIGDFVHPVQVRKLGFPELNLLVSPDLVSSCKASSLWCSFKSKIILVGLCCRTWAVMSKPDIYSPSCDHVNLENFGRPKHRWRWRHAGRSTASRSAMSLFGSNMLPVRDIIMTAQVRGYCRRNNSIQHRRTEKRSNT